jgi:hypothetical protein
MSQHLDYDGLRADTVRQVAKLMAAASVVLGLGPLRNATARRTTGLAILAGLGAFLVDVYLY